MKLWLIGTVAAVALLSGCGNKDEAASTDLDAIKAGEITLPAVNLREGNAAQAEAALGALSLTQSGSGRISFADRTVTGADAVFSNVAIAMDDDEQDAGDAGTFTAQTLTFKGLDMTDGEASFAQMSLAGIVLLSEEGDDNSNLNIADMQISNPSPALAAWVGSLFGQGDPTEFPDLDELSFDAFSMNSLTASGDEDNEQAEFEIASIDFREMSPEGLGAMMFEGLNFSATDESDGTVTNVSLGSLNILGIGEIMTKALSGELGEDGPSASNVFSLLASNPGDPGYDSIRMEDLNFDVGGLQLAMPSYDANVTRDNQGRAVRTKLEPFKATINADADGEIGGEFAGQLGLLGYETLVIGGAGDSRIDHENDMVMADAKSNYLELEDGFRMSFGGEFGGLSAFYSQLAESDLEDLGDDPSDVLAMLSQLSLHGMEISFDDDSFAERAFTAAAAMNGGTPDELKDQLKLSLGFAPLMAGSAGVDVDIVTELTAALGDFISKPGTLTLKLDPDAPITADMFEDPTALTKDVIGFSASSK